MSQLRETKEVCPHCEGTGYDNRIVNLKINTFEIRPTFQYSENCYK